MFDGNSYNALFNILFLTINCRTMKNFFLLFLLSISIIGFGQTNGPKVFVFVHGAWDGGWDYKKVDSILTAKGDIAYRPTLTGLGERCHLANANINLSTHINDIVNVFKYEDLHNAILVGHSYGGMVISGVAEQIPERIKTLIYLDAFVPDNGESLQKIIGPAWDEFTSQLINDSIVAYPFGTPNPNPPNDVPQPLRTFTQTLRISNPLVKKIPTYYILMTKDGKASFEEWGASRARGRGWKIFTMDGGHYSMREQPEALIKKLEEVLNND